MLILPKLFLDGGILLGAILMLISGFISYVTSEVIVSNIKKRESDVLESLDRVLNRKWALLYSIVSAIFFFVFSVIYYYLNIDMLYEIICFFLKKSGYENFAELGELTLSKFSETWV